MKENSSFFTSRTARITALLVILILGFAIRIYDLTDLPLEFHSTRQLLSALKARGMYYQSLTDAPAEQRSFAIQQWKFRASVEPEVLERVVAFTYQFTGEKVWIARIYSAFFWMIGALFLFLLARSLTSTDGALAAAAFYLFLPYGVTASRSFQPDPLMVMLVIIFLWAAYKWSLTLNKTSDHEGGKGIQRKTVVTLRDPSWLKSWFFAILAGLFGGLAIFIKFVAAFFIIGGGLGALLRRGSIREALKQPQVYVMTALGILPGAAYVIYGVFIAGYLGQQFGGRFIPELFLSPAYYLGWIGMLNLVIGGGALMLALLGLFFWEKEKRRFILGLWAGYALFGIYFNYHISTHDYYSLPLIPIAALSLAPLADWFFAQLAKLTISRWMRLVAYCVLLLGISMSLWNTRAQMNSVDYRPETAMWQEIGQRIGDKTVTGLTQDYGARLAYWGWKSGPNWPQEGDIKYRLERGGKFDFDKTFDELTAGKDYFLVTDFDQLDRQPLLQERLSQFPVVFSGDGYVIYNLGAN
jgi:hypothetical protein